MPLAFSCSQERQAAQTGGGPVLGLEGTAPEEGDPTMLAAGHRVRTHPVHPVQGLEGAEVFDLRDHLVEPLDGGQTFQETAPGELLAPGGAQPSREGQGRVGQEPPHGAGPGPAKGGGVCQTTLPKVAETVVDQGGAEVGEGGEIAGSGQRQLRKPVEQPGVALRQPGAGVSE